MKVNDRLRKRRYEIIDLSRAAAQELDFIRQGKIKVRIPRWRSRADGGTGDWGER